MTTKSIHRWSIAAIAISTVLLAVGLVIWPVANSMVEAARRSAAEADFRRTAKVYKVVWYIGKTPNQTQFTIARTRDFSEAKQIAEQRIPAEVRARFTWSTLGGVEEYDAAFFRIEDIYEEGYFGGLGSNTAVFCYPPITSDLEPVDPLPTLVEMPAWHVVVNQMRIKVDKIFDSRSDANACVEDAFKEQMKTGKWHWDNFYFVPLGGTATLQKAGVFSGSQNMATVRHITVLKVK